MLNKQNRLKEKKDFEKVFKKGKSYFCDILGIKTTENNQKINRFAVVVGAKISKKANERNRVKKRIKDVLRRENQNLKPGKDFVVITLPEIKNKEYKEIKEALIKGLNKLNAYQFFKKNSNSTNQGLSKNVVAGSWFF